MWKITWLIFIYALCTKFHFETKAKDEAEIAYYNRNGETENDL